MRPGTWNLLFGIVAISAGLHGGMVLMGTNSSQLLVAAGALVAVIGVIQLWRSRKR